jgi:FtsZ-binding cell division protein ZapB
MVAYCASCYDSLRAALAERLKEAQGLRGKLAYVEHGLKCRQDDEGQAHRSFHESMDKIPLEVKNLHDSKASIAESGYDMVDRAESAERESRALREERDAWRLKARIANQEGR